MPSARQKIPKVQKCTHSSVWRTSKNQKKIKNNFMKTKKRDEIYMYTCKSSTKGFFIFFDRKKVEICIYTCTKWGQLIRSPKSKYAYIRANPWWPQLGLVRNRPYNACIRANPNACDSFLEIISSKKPKKFQNARIVTFSARRKMIFFFQNLSKNHQFWNFFFQIPYFFN